MNHPFRRIFGLALAAAFLTAGSSPASECVRCHTDAAKLKEITRQLPQKEASSETAGKG